MGEIINIKNNKGGVGKTFISAQIAHGLTLLGKKVLILTSDSQNNIFDYLLKGNSEFEKGLKAEVSKGTGEYFRLRENLYFLPLEKSSFGNGFVQELAVFLEKKRKEYDYIIIDSIPVLKIDNIFLEHSDHIIIPAYCDEVTLKGVINLLNEVDVNKVKAIMINKYRNSEVQNYFLDQLKSLESLNLQITNIKLLSFIEKMLYNRKTIWEYSSKNALEVQDEFLKVIKSIIGE